MAALGVAGCGLAAAVAELPSCSTSRRCVLAAQQQRWSQVPCMHFHIDLEHVYYMFNSTVHLHSTPVTLPTLI